MEQKINLMKTIYQYFSKWRKEWFDLPAKEQPFYHNASGEPNLFFVNKMKEYHYQIRTILK
jgi:hypothetical protein